MSGSAVGQKQELLWPLRLCTHERRLWPIRPIRQIRPQQGRAVWHLMRCIQR